ncbi:MAG: zinc-dependent dehydrogenase [Candidatus Bathyarchaeia archaeon]
MKVAMYYNPNDIRYEDVPTPEIGPEEILVEMRACGVCGSDLMDWYLRSRAPLVLGHEPAGVVARVGEKVDGFKPGDRVFVHHHVPCLTCHYCTHGDYTLCERFRETHIDPGGFAEHFRVPAPNVRVDTLRLPDGLSFEEAALIEPVACCVKALRRCRIQPGDTVAIIGAGTSGIIHTILSRGFGAGRVIVSDLIDYRLEAAERFGADLVVNLRRESLVDRVKGMTGRRGADLVVVTAPNVQALSEGIDACRMGGALCLFAPTPPEEWLRLSPHRLFFSEITLIPSYSTSHVETRMALGLISSGRIKVGELITHRFPLSRTGDAFELAAGSRECLKVIVLSDGD